MAGRSELGYLDYLKEAFSYRPRIPLLGRMPVNQLALAAFAVLGIANPGFWFLGAATELGYLAWLSSHPRFQALVRGERLQEKKESYEERIRRALGRLPGESRMRYERLLGQCREVVGISETLDDGIANLRSLRAGSLNQLLWIFLRLLTSQHLLRDSIRRVDRDVLARDMEETESRLAELGESEADSALGRSLRGMLDIQRKRIENLEKAASSLLVIEAELERIEQQVVLIREEAAVSGKAEILSDRLESVTVALSQTNEWMDRHAELLGDLGADPLGAAPRELPDLPETVETAPKRVAEGER